jgi:hypothetical protein
VRGRSASHPCRVAERNLRRRGRRPFMAPTRAPPAAAPRGYRAVQRVTVGGQSYSTTLIPPNSGIEAVDVRSMMTSNQYQSCSLMVKSVKSQNSDV